MSRAFQARSPLFTLALAPAAMLALTAQIAHAEEPAPSAPATVSPPTAAPVAPAPSDDVAPLPAADPVTPPTAPVAAPAAKAALGTYVELHADDGRATIERRVGTSSYAGLPFAEAGFASVGHWQHACVAPCRMRLDPRFSYRVAGDGLVATDSFALPEGKDRVRVDAKMGSSTGRVAGILLTGAGALGVAVGGAALGVSPILASEEVGSQAFRTGVVAGGVGVLGVGLLTMGAGLYLWLTNGSTTQTESSAALAPKRAGAGVKVLPNGVAF